jgi:hypothetical protein
MRSCIGLLLRRRHVRVGWFARREKTA